jgi:hypothetical protein
VLRDYKGVDGPFPSEVLWEKKAWAKQQLAGYLEKAGVRAA